MLWVDEQVYYPVHAPARHFAKGKSDPAFRTKLAIGAELAVKARDAGFAFRAAVADGDQDGFRSELAEAGLPFVMALNPRRGDQGLRPRRAHSGGRSPRAALGRLVAATADLGTVSLMATWYLSPTCPGLAGHARPAACTRRPAWPRSSGSTGIRNWIGQGYMQVKDEFGWTDFQPIRAARAWLVPRITLQRWWAAWSKAPRPTTASPDQLGRGRGYSLCIYIPN